MSLMLRSQCIEIEYEQRNCPDCEEKSIMLYDRVNLKYRMECSSCFYKSPVCNSPELADWHFRNGTLLDRW